jgi:uncharacterized protein
MLRRLLAVLLLPLSASAWSADSGLVPVPTLTARVTDLTQTLSAEQRSALEQKLAAFEAQKGSQIAVLMVPTTQPEEIEQYSIRVVDAWKLGRAKVDDGALLIVAKNDRRMRIEVGRGLEGALPDAIAKRIIAETITPLFKQGDFAGGIDAGVSQMMSVVQGEALPPPTQRDSAQGNERLARLLGPFFIFWFIGSLLRKAIGTFPTAALVGVGTGFAGTFLLGSALLGGGLGVVALIFAFILYSGGGGGGYYGGGFGGGGFGGGGGGGFSGGGGGFSGGGSSGSW